MENQRKQIAVIRLRGRTGLQGDVAATLHMLNIRRVNHCAIVPDSPDVVGMLKKAKDYITWGYVDSDTLKLLLEKRGEPALAGGRNFVAVNGKNYKPYFRLSPAKGGLGSRGVKASFTNAGALGDRKDKVNELLRRMI
ncbi:uL30 family ribosomal protein [Candidatus Woesearchaeota archaeon]|nr:uL30 family ribosomal protein [Candidatus Woesearchaeota archaeon]